MKWTLLVVLVIAFYSCQAYALNEHIMHQESLYNSSGGGGSGGVVLLLSVASIAIGAFLAFSNLSPIRAWADKNAGLAFWSLVWGFPIVVLLLARL